MKEVGYQEQLESYRSKSTGKESYAAALKRSRGKTKAKKKALKYNHREVSGMLMRAKRTQSAEAALSVAKSKLGTLKRNAASGQYDRTEVSRAVTHAMRMVRCAELKVRNMKQEDNNKSKAKRDDTQKKLQRKHERKRNVEKKKQQKLKQVMAKQLKEIQRKKRELEELERKKRSNRLSENNKVMEADMKYIKSALGQDDVRTVSMAAAVLELGGEFIPSDAQLEVQADQEMGSDMSIASPTIDVVSVDLAMTGGMPSVDGAGAAVDVAL